MILFIEDDIMLSEEISEFLKENDFEVEVVGNGDDALKLLQSRIYDLCILDIGLPDCSGFLLCKKIRQFYRNPIIIFTAYENEEDIVTGLMAGADDYETMLFESIAFANFLAIKKKAMVRRNRNRNYKKRRFGN